MTLKRFYATTEDAALDAAAHWRERSARARAKLDGQKDPALYFKRIIRARDANRADAEQRARDEYRTRHATVSSRIPQSIHPQVAELLARFLAENGLDGKDLPLPLIEEGETLDATIARYR